MPVSSDKNNNGHHQQDCTVSVVAPVTADNDDVFASAGFMFDACQATKTCTFTFTACEATASNRGPIICLSLDSVDDDDPGALQSGHYIWPASPALAQYIVDTYYDSPNAVSRILELGAGCALVALCAYELFTNSSLVVITDHDPGTLKRAESNFQRIATKETSRSSKTAVIFEELKWCDSESYARNFLLQLRSKSRATTDISDNMDAEKFDLILGSDLIYCQENVRPLLRTVSCLLANNTDSKLILSQSFSYSDQTEREIDDICEECNLKRCLLSTTREGESYIAIQEISFRR